MRRYVIISVILMSVLMTAAIASAKERVFYYHNDHLGTPQVMTDEDGVTVWEAEYLPFGEAAVNEDPDGDGALVVSNIRFPGQYYDAETGLHYNWHRDYQPQTGRYQEADPTGIDQGRNHLYIYAYNNPIAFIDSIGLRAACSYSISGKTFACFTRCKTISCPASSGNNNSKDQCVVNTGPIPEGYYDIGVPIGNWAKLSPTWLKLKCASRRSGFWIHGWGTSKGCIMMRQPCLGEILDYIRDEGGGYLNVQP